MSNGQDKKKKKKFDPDAYLAKKPFDPDAYLGRRATAPASATATTTFPYEKEQSRPLGDVAGDILAPFSSFSPLGYPKSGKQLASEIGTAAEVGLPLLAAPLRGPVGRAVGGGLLQGTGTVIKGGLEAVAKGEKYPLDKLAADFATSAGIGTVFGGAAEGAVGLVGGIKRPFASGYDAPLEATAKKYGLDMPASAFTEHPGVPLLESLSGKSVFSNKMTGLLLDVETKLVRSGDDLLRQIKHSTSPTEIGQTVSRGFRDHEQVFRATKNSLFDAAKLEGTKIPITPEKGLQELDNVISELVQIRGEKPPVLNRLLKLRADLVPEAPEIVAMRKAGMPQNVIDAVERQGGLSAPKEITAEEIRATVKDLNTKINFKNPDAIVQGYEGQIRRITAALSEDLDEGIKVARPDLAEAIDKANAFYKKGVTRLNSAWGQKINKFIDTGQEDKIAQTILNRNTSIEQIPKIFETVGAEGTEALKASALNEIITAAKSTATGRFTPTGLNAQIKVYGDERLGAIFSPKQVSTLKELGELSRVLSRGEKIRSGSATAFLMRILGHLSMLTHNPLSALKLMVGDKALSEFVTSKTGQQWLRQGFKTSPVTAPVAATASRVAGQQLSEGLDIPETVRSLMQ